MYNFDNRFISMFRVFLYLSRILAPRASKSFLAIKFDDECEGLNIQCRNTSCNTVKIVIIVELFLSITFTSIKKRSKRNPFEVLSMLYELQKGRYIYRYKYVVLCNTFCR